jgi:hypothetical protein
MQAAKRRRRRFADAEPRPRWDDPDMPVFRGGAYHPASAVQAHHAALMSVTGPYLYRHPNGGVMQMIPSPTWRNDPTYNMKKR